MRDFAASLPLASEVASPARLARGAALSAAVAASSAARAENSRTVGLARSARSSTASRSDSRIAVALPAAPAPVEPVERPAPVEPVPAWSARLALSPAWSPVQVKVSSGVGSSCGFGVSGSVIVVCSSARGGGARSSSHEPREAGTSRWSGQSRDSGSTSTDHGASTPPSSSADRVGAAQDDVPAPAVGPPGDVRRRRSDDGHRGSPFRGSLAEPLGHRLRLALGGGRVGQADGQLDEAPERRRPEPLAQGELRVVEGRPVAARGGPDRRVLGLVGLDDRVARDGRRGRPARSPGPGAGTSARRLVRRAG